MTIRIVCFVMLNQIFLPQSDLCPGENVGKCCIGFKWNDALRKCLPCDDGYHGTNCSTKCHFPRYGVNCMSHCSCAKTDCNHVYGCVESKEACKNGFTGINCVTKCQYPTYGQDCQSLCDCNATVCDHVNGCTQSSGSTSSVTINTTKYHTSSCYNKKTESSRIHSLMFAVIGLTSVSVMIYIVYFHTRMLEKRQTNTSIFT